jgi:carbonic anhydrase
MSNYIKILPNSLIKRYKVWKTTAYEENKNWYTKIAIEGQNPLSMVISCCDSRVHATSIFGAENGEFFIHRNIANLVPPYNPNGDYHGTSAAVEYALNTLNVSHIIILGHSDCGGIKSGSRLFCGNQILDESIFVNKWLNILKPAYENIKKNINQFDELNNTDLEKESIKLSLNNLTDFPFVKSALNKKKLALHGVWHDIGSGTLEVLDPISMNFKKI